MPSRFQPGFRRPPGPAGWVGLWMLLASCLGVSAQSSFLYQGQLLAGGKSTGTADYDMVFGLYGVATGGTAVATAINVKPVKVVDGVFSVSLDFGAGAFNGQARWLEISVRLVKNPPVAYELLSPRQPIVYTPQALYALTVADGSVTAAKVGGVLNSSSIPTLDAAKIGTGTLDPARIPNLDAAKLTSGFLADARLTLNVPLLNRANIFTGADTFNGTVVAPNANNQFAGTFTGTFTGNGAGLTGLNANQVTVGLLPDARLSSAIARVTDVNVASAALQAQITQLQTQLSQLTSLVGATYVSADPADPLLLARGLSRVVTVAAPAWANGSVVTDPTHGVPSARSGHSAVWTGQEWIIWGGQLGAGQYAGSGGWYRPDLDVWTPVSTVGAPSPRNGHTAVWTGSEMIIWGGFSGVGFLDTGGRFSVTKQAWNVSGVPASGLAARDGHVAVWTGTRLLIWGGRNRNGVLADGALYEPVANTWTLLPTTGAPSARAHATGVWTGDRLLVWGGDGSSSYLGDGAQLLFNAGVPAAAWQPLGLASAPSPRTGHTAVWTGSRMLVWGGLNGSPLDTGAAYDPTAGTWTSLAPAGAPTARTQHDAVWTGSEWVIYGGETAAGTTATGAAYDPVLGHWRTLSNPGAPQARSGATAAWTGSEVLFFGGRNAGTPLAALQRLNPQPTWYFFRKP